MLRPRASRPPISWRDVLLAKTDLDDPRATGIQFILITVWHGTVFPATLAALDWLLGYGASSNGVAAEPEQFDIGRASEFFIDPFIVPILLSMLLIEGLLSWITFRWVTRHLSVSFGAFIRCWWWMCLWGIIALPTVCLAFAAISRNYSIAMNLPIAWPAATIVAPALIFRAASRRCISRWRPVCPECGYSLRGLTEPRCPECGEGFPCPGKIYRRWAVRRLPWDRAKRGSIASAYVKSLLLVAVLPARAARGVSIPDRWHRCIRWAAVHFFLAVIAALLLADDQKYVGWVLRMIRPPEFRPPHLFSFTDPPLGRVLVWAGQSLVGWTLTLGFPVAAACLISVCWPGRHRAAKLGGVKWALYLLSLLSLVMMTWYGFYLVFPPSAQAGIPVAFTFRLPLPDIPTWMLVGPYGVWWSMGTAANPYNRRRNCGAFLGFVCAFIGIWLLFTRVLFAPGLLEGLK